MSELSPAEAVFVAALEKPPSDAPLFWMKPAPATSICEHAWNTCWLPKPI